MVMVPGVLVVGRAHRGLRRWGRCCGALECRDADGVVDVHVGVFPGLFIGVRASIVHNVLCIGVGAVVRPLYNPGRERTGASQRAATASGATAGPRPRAVAPQRTWPAASDGLKDTVRCHLTLGWDGRGWEVGVLYDYHRKLRSQAAGV